MAKFFISYAREQKTRLDDIIHPLGRIYGKNTIWWDTELRPTDDWWQEILTEISKCEIFIFLMSKDSLESEYCQKELNAAMRMNKNLIVIKVDAKTDIDRQALPQFRDLLNRLNYIDAIQGLDGKITTELYAAVDRLENPLANLPEMIEIRKEMSFFQYDLQQSLDELLNEVGKKLSKEEKKAIQKEFDELNDILERLKTGVVWIALFGKTSVGKSSIANALIGDDIAPVDVKHGTTISASAYQKDQWMLVDVPGTMNNDDETLIAVNEAKRAHGLIFAIDGEPYETELKYFDEVYRISDDKPIIVFVNKWEIKEAYETSANLQHIKARIHEKMRKYVKSDADIIYGTAARKLGDEMVRQKLPQLLERLYAGAGTLGVVMNILNPASRTGQMLETIHEKVLQVRIGIARQVIRVFGWVSVSTALVPFASLATIPAVLSPMVYAIFRVMGRKDNRESTLKVTSELVGAMVQEFGITFAALVGLEMINEAFNFIPGIGWAISSAIDLGLLGFWKFRRTITLGEITIEYIRNDCSWGQEGVKKVVNDARKRAEHLYGQLKIKDEQ